MISAAIDFDLLRTYAAAAYLDPPVPTDGSVWQIPVGHQREEQHVEVSESLMPSFDFQYARFLDLRRVLYVL